MLHIDNIALNGIALHKVGNKMQEEGLILSKSLLKVNEEIKNLLIKYFLNAFKSEEYYCFQHETSLDLNEAYTYASAIFDNPKALHEQSINLAKHLYQHSEHPKIKGGEFYTVYFEDCILDGETMDAIGVFKSENKDTFLEIEHYSEGFSIDSREGININKLDKGCLIFNTEKDNGYLLSIVDNTNKGVEAQYWKDDFLSVLQVKNEFHQTNEFLGIAKQFVTKQLSQDFELTKADQIDLLNRSVQYFKTHEKFEKDNFEQEVFQDGEIIDSFRGFNDQFKKENQVEVADNFDISSQAVKKQARVFKSVLKLDKNFHIYIHGDRQLIEQGVDNDGRKYYKIYYQAES